uniref:Uncharacterized protein n=1 Tax=Myotis myotis TaxID=51298 RepID=A0A7J7WHU3_MYOMY|nr:hypothetical protein mMyoMyo1_012166 [Myotis myotis]
MNCCPAPLASLDSAPGLGSAGMWAVHPRHVNPLSLSPPRCPPSLPSICGSPKPACSFSKLVGLWVSVPTCCPAPAGTGTAEPHWASGLPQSPPSVLLLRAPPLWALWCPPRWLNAVSRACSCGLWQVTQQQLPSPSGATPASGGLLTSGLWV